MAAPAILLRFFGVELLDKAFEEILEAAKEEQRRGDWYVVSVVEYAPVLEFEVPHWRPAIHKFANDMEFNEPEQRDMLNAMIAGGSLNKKVAMKLRTRIRAAIQNNGLVDTGNYLGSIAIGRSIPEALAQSQSQLLHPETSVFA